MSRKADKKTTLGIGMLGAGYMGKALSVGFRSAPTVFELDTQTRLEMIATRHEHSAQQAANSIGYAHYTTDVQALIEHPDVDIVVVATPPDNHQQAVELAAKAGKAVFCEKPLAIDLQAALQMCQAVEQAGVPNMVGYNYSKTPAAQLIKQMIEAGELGEIIAFHGRHVEDFLHDPSIPANWRTRVMTGGEAGALGDVGSHIIAAALRLMGPIESLCCDRRVVIAERGNERVENDDSGEMLLQFQSGARGTLVFSRVFLGKKMGYDFEIVGTKGSLRFDQEQQNELHFFSAKDPSGRSGFKRILTGPDHPDYQAFCLGAGHGNGYNDMMSIQAKDFIRMVQGGAPNWADFRFGLQVDQVVEAAVQSSHARSWVTLGR